MSDLDTKTSKSTKIIETKSSILFYCFEKFIENRKDKKLRCGKSDFLIKDIYEELFKRIINPIYIVILSLISSLIILKSKTGNIQSYYKLILFFLGFIIIIFSELSYKFIPSSLNFEIILLLLPIIIIFLFYLLILIKTKFKLSYL